MLRRQEADLGVWSAGLQRGEISRVLSILGCALSSGSSTDRLVFS